MYRGTYQMHILGAIAEFERARIAERVKAGLQRAKTQGRRLGRPKRELPPAVAQFAQAADSVSVREAAKRLGVSRSTAQRWLASQKTCSTNL